jgi:hypothetical protein
MPNWVSNQLNITGPKEELDRFQAQAGKAYSTKKQTFTDEGISWIDEISQEELSFWNFISPDESILEEYFGPQPQHTLEQALRHEGNHWYDWNVRNWGVKWDAGHVYMDRDSDTKLVYTFETPWSAPEPVFLEMVESFPELSFEYRFLEEQGWGGEYHASEGLYWIVDEWEIPETHADRMDKIGYCYCQEIGENDDLEYLFDDCPPKMALTASK